MFLEKAPLKFHGKFYEAARRINKFTQNLFLWVRVRKPVTLSSESGYFIFQKKL